MTLRTSGGAEITVRRLGEQTPFAVEVLGSARPMMFERCPICLDPDPDSDEHVPPEAIGGAKMTWTCSRCNNRLGSVTERTLVDWWEDAITSVAFAHDDVRGARKTSRILLRQTANGEPFYLLDRGHLDQEIASRLQPGSRVQVTFAPPDPRRYRLAALKSAYLGACLLLRSIPHTPEADAIRAELVAATKLARRQRPEISRQTENLWIAKSHGPAAPGEVLLVRVQPTGDSPAKIVIALSRTLLVDWPLGGTFVQVNDDGTATAL